MFWERKWERTHHFANRGYDSLRLQTKIKLFILVKSCISKSTFSGHAQTLPDQVVLPRIGNQCQLIFFVFPYGSVRSLLKHPMNTEVQSLIIVIGFFLKKKGKKRNAIVIWFCVIRNAVAISPRVTGHSDHSPLFSILSNPVGVWKKCHIQSTK